YRTFFIEFFCFLFIFFFNDLYTSLLGLDLRNYFQQPSWIYRIDLTISIGIWILHGSQSYSLRVLRKSSGFHFCRWMIEVCFIWFFYFQLIPTSVYTLRSSLSDDTVVAHE